MDISFGPDGSVTISPDYKFLADSVLHVGGFKTSKERFLEIRKLVSSNRAEFSVAARDYFRSRGFDSLGESALLVSDNSIFPQLIKLGPDDRYLAFDDANVCVEFDGVKLPIKSESFIENIVKYRHGDWEKAPYHRKGLDTVYRLSRFNENPTNPLFTFNRCEYKDYVNTCEYHAHSIVDNFVSISNWQSAKSVTSKYVTKGAISNPFAFDELNCAVGINTLLVLADPNEPLFLMHNRRTTTVAEAKGLKHVVPAGTFQPIHRENSNHDLDFSLYANVLRELSEELLGDSDLTHPVGYKENLYDRPSVRPIHHLLNIDRAAIYFAGFGIDALTAKPEFLTIMVLVRQDLENLFPEGFLRFAEANNEGRVFQEDFTIGKLEKWRDDPKTLAAGSGCLQVAINNFGHLVSYGSD